MVALPEITQEFQASTAPYVAGLQLAIDAAERFRDMNLEAVIATDDLGNAMTGTAGVAAATAGRVNDLRDSILEAGIASGDLVGGLGDVRTAAASASAAAGALSRSMTGLAAKATGVLVPALSILDAELDKKIAALTATAGAAGLLSGAMTVSTARSADAAAGIRIWGTGLRLTGTAIHWIIAGSLELMAVLAPATVAAGAWAAVWLQGTVNVAQHMNAVYTATEAMANAGSRTAGQMVGLGDALQQAQNKANPDVYQALGGAINLVKENAGGLANVGLQVGRIFDTFMARVVYDFSAAGSQGKMLSNVLSGMIPDLTGIGQIFGNLGHLLLSFASQMPGLAEVLLGVLDVITRLAVSVVDFADKIHIGSWSILTFLMAMEEFARWGGLLVGIMGRIGFSTTALEGNFASVTGFFQRFGSVALNLVRAPLMLLGTGIASLGNLASRLPGRLGAAGAAVEGFGADVSIASATMSTWAAVGILGAAAALGFIVYKILSAKTATQEFTDALQQAVQKANALTVLGTIGNNLEKLQTAIHGVTDGQFQMNAVMNGGYAAGLKYGAVVAAQRSAMQALTAEQTREVSQGANVITGAQQIAQKYGVSVPAAMALAASAGVNLTGVIMNQKGQWTALGEKINDAYRGFLAMGQSSGMIGNDMLAVAIQSGLAATKVSQLNQAWDSFMQNVTGGTGALSQLEESITNIGHVVTNTANHLASSTGGMTLSTKQFADALTTYTGKGAQAWSNFDQIVGSTLPQMADWFRTAGAEGAIGLGQMRKAMLDAASTMTPFAAKSKTAQAELVAFAQSAGLNIHTFPQLESAIQASGASTKDLEQKVSATTIAMGNMASVAQNLGDVMNSDVTAAFSAAALKATGFNNDANNLAQALKNGTSAGHNAAYWAQQAGEAYRQAGSEAATAAGKVAGVNAQLNATPRNVDVNINTYYHQYGSTGGGTYGHKPIPANAAGAAYTGGGATLVGEHGPEIVDMPRGASVTPSWATAPYMRGGGGGAGGAGEATIHNHVYLDGEEIWRNQQRHTFGYNTLNSGSRTGNWSPS